MKKVSEKVKDGLGRVCPAGVFVEPGGMAAGDIEGPLEVIFAGLVGTLGGFVVGMLIGSLVRIFTINSIKGSRGGMHWGAYGACAGALAMAAIALIT